jgi:cytohesin/brefeldin A-inhibited guanine nucleotide-exchange protein
MKGDIFLKVCRSTNKFVQRRVFLSEDETKVMWVSDPPQNDTPRFILISDITDLTLGIGSTVMQRNKVPSDFDSLCFTITASSRTLDLKARTTKERGKWINYLRAILIQRRDQRRDQL